jgi:hypothetical protein
MSFRSDAVKGTVQFAFDTYKDNERISTLLDDKAQKVGSLASVFLAAAFGFIKLNDLNTLGSSFGRYLGIVFIVTVATFIVCLGTCLSVMWVRTLPSPVDISVLSQMHLDISALSSEEITDSMEHNFFYEMLQLWQPVLDGQSAINSIKGYRLRWAQVLAAAGMLFVATLLVAVIFRTLSHH